MKLLKKIFFVFVFLSLIDYVEFGKIYENSTFVQQCSLAPKVPKNFWEKLGYVISQCHCPNIPKIPTETIVHYLIDLNITKTMDDILSNIEKYLGEYQPYGKVKEIRIVKNQINLFGQIVRNKNLQASFYENGECQKTIELIDKTIRTSIKCAEWDIAKMHRQTPNPIYNGVEYVSFIIPKKPKYVFGGNYADHNVSENFIVTVRSNFADSAEQIIRKMFNFDYWDDAKFQQECQTYDSQEILYIRYTLIEMEVNDGNIYKKTA